MISLPGSTEFSVLEDIKNLQDQLDSNCLAAEKLMSLREPNQSDQRCFSTKSDLLYKN